MDSNDCVFCKMVEGQIPVTKVYEDQAVMAFLDIAPVSRGHTLLIPKQHFSRLHDCPAEHLAKVCSSLGTVSAAVASAMNADGYNVLCNTGRAAGQVVEHLHFHIIPRRTGDGLFTHWPASRYEQGKIEQVAQEIRKHL